MISDTTAFERLVKIGKRTALALVAATLASGCAWTGRVSVATNGTQGNGLSFGDALSDDGRFVAFTSQADNLLAPGTDTNANQDAFVRDLATSTTTRVSVATGGGQASGSSGSPSLSDDARYVAFSSTAENLVAGDTNNRTDVFLHDRSTGTTTRISTSSSGTQGNNTSWRQMISGNGRFIVFDSSSTNLVTGDTNAANDVFVRDRITGVTERVSFLPSGLQFPCGASWGSISDDGRYVAFQASPCIFPGMPVPGQNIFVRDRTLGTTTLVGHGSSSEVPIDNQLPIINGNGNFVLFFTTDSTLVPGDTNNQYDAYVFDRTLGTYERVSVGSFGVQGNNFTGIGGDISDDGRLVVFSSNSTNLVPNDTNGVIDLFMHDRVSGITTRISTDPFFAQANAQSADPHLSGDGKYALFTSEATNIVGGDTNALADAFVQATNRPSVFGIAPANVARGFSGPVTITGENFEAGAAVLANLSKVSFTNVVVVNDTTITATMSVAADALRQPYTVIVANPGGTWQPAAGTADDCTNCLVVQ